MRRYVEIQLQSPTDGSGFVAQWYAGGERSGQAFSLVNTGELLFFTYFTESPMIVSDEATRALLHERGYNVVQRGWLISLSQAASPRESSPAFVFVVSTSVVYGYGQSRAIRGAERNFRASSCDCAIARPPRRQAANSVLLCDRTATTVTPTVPLHSPSLASVLLFHRAHLDNERLPPVLLAAVLS
jgi:hypothetical protein